MESLQTSTESIFEAFLDYSSGLFLVLDKSGRILKANAYAKQQLGKQIENQMFDRIILDFYSTFELSAVEKELEDSQPSDVVHALNVKHISGMPQTYLFRFCFTDKTIYAFGELNNDELESVRKEILGLNEELNNLTRELHKKNALLEQLNREKNQFLGMAAHDLRKPIGLAMTYSDFLIEEAGPILDEEQNGFLSTIHKSCVFMKRLVDDFLDVSAIEAGKFDLDLHPSSTFEVLEQSLRLNQLQAAKKEIRLNVQTPQDIPKVMMDASKIEQVITNLVSNAIEHTAPQTTVAIELSVKADHLVFSVEDEGPGIAPGELKRLFEPFEKTSTKKTGGEKSTGLGMVITRKIIEAHEGEIWVESVLGKGTIVFFTLPMTWRGHG